MKKLLLLCLFMAVISSGRLDASTTDHTVEYDPEDESEIQLPRWEGGEAYESFDVRIWPEDVIIWLEQENMRDLIADPSTPEAERN